MSRRRVSAVDPHHVEVLIFHPDAADESRAAHFRCWRYIKNIASHLAKEFPPGIAELVVGPVELSSIDKNHLQEPGRFKGPQWRNLPRPFNQRVNFEPPSKVCLSEKIEIGLRKGAHQLVGPHYLYVGLNNGSIEIKSRDRVMLLLNRPFDDFIQLGCRLGNLRDGAFVLCILGTRCIWPSACLSLRPGHVLRLWI